MSRIKSLKNAKVVTRDRNSQDRQYNGQKKKDKKTNNDLHNMINILRNKMLKHLTSLPSTQARKVRGHVFVC